MGRKTDKVNRRTFATLKQSKQVLALLNVCNATVEFPGRWWKTERRKLVTDVDFLIAAVPGRRPAMARRQDLHEYDWGVRIPRPRFKAPQVGRNYVWASGTVDGKNVKGDIEGTFFTMADAWIGLNSIVRANLTTLLHRCPACRQLLFSRTNVCPGPRGRGCSDRLRAPHRAATRKAERVLNRRRNELTLDARYAQEYPGRNPKDLTTAEKRAALRRHENRANPLPTEELAVRDRSER
jgi:hypothetical protein